MILFLVNRALCLFSGHTTMLVSPVEKPVVTHCRRCGKPTGWQVPTPDGTDAFRINQGLVNTAEQLRAALNEANARLEEMKHNAIERTEAIDAKD